MGLFRKPFDAEARASGSEVFGEVKDLSIGGAQV
jgi:hypothetical protein